MPSRPVILAIEDTDRLHGMLRAGRYISAALDAEIVILPVADTDEALAQMDGEVRLALAGDPRVRLARTSATYRHQAAIAEMIRRLDGSFLIAQFGGVAAPRGKPLGSLITGLGCPLLLVR